MKVHPFSIAPEQEYVEKISNYLFDVVMPTLSPSEWMVLCFILRKTRGFHKESDTISINQIKEGTGIKTDATIIKSVNTLVEKSYILAIRRGNTRQANTYSLNTDLEIELTTTKNEVATTIENIVEDGTTLKNVVTTTENTVVTTTKNEVVALTTSKIEDTKESIDSNIYLKDVESLPKGNGAGAPKPKIKKPPVEKIELEPNSPIARLLFAKINRNRAAKGQNNAKYYPSLECKEKFDNTCLKFTYDEMSERIDRALQIGITDIVGIVDFTAKYDPNKLKNGNGAQTNGQPKRKEQPQQPQPSWLGAAHAATHQRSTTKGPA